MGQFIQSPFLHALGYAIINSLWQFALLWLLYVLVNTVIKLTSHQKYISGLVLQIAGFVWFLGTLYFYYNQCKEIAGSMLWLQSNYTVDLFGTGDTSFRERFFRWIIQTERFLPYLSVAYLALLTFLGLKWLQAYNYTQSVRKNGLLKIHANWRVFVQQLSYQLGLKRSISIYVSELVKTPLTIGFFKPIILIPLASLNHLSTEQMEAVIIHELAHIKRLDYLFNLFLALIEAGLFFNPFMQLISRHIKRERENCCDDWVLQYEYNAATYARALLQIASYQSNSPSLALKATDDKQVLLGRIKRMIEKKEKTFFNYRHQLLALFVMTIVFSALAFLSPNNNKPTAAANNKPVTPISVQPLAASVENPLFNPVFFLAKEEKEKVEHKPKVSELRKNVVSISSLPIESKIEKFEIEEAPVIAEKALALVDKKKVFEEIKLPFLEANVFETPVKPNSSLVFPMYSEEIKTRDAALRVFSKVHPIVQTKKREIDQQKVLKDIRAALEKVRTSKRLLELVVAKSLATNIPARNQILIDLTGAKLRERQELELAEQKLEQQLNEQLEELNERNIAHTAANTAYQFDFQMPKVAYTSAVQTYPNYSDEYSGNSNPENFTSNNNIECEKQKTKITCIVDEDSELREVVRPALKEVKQQKVVTKPRKKIYIIRI
jgi:beta-lactamase regulating signal transducer with metallopeptidase domain